MAAAQVGADPAGVSEETHFHADLNYDSLDDVEFVMTLEDAFDVSIADEDTDGVRTVGAAVELLCAALKLPPEA